MDHTIGTNMAHDTHLDHDNVEETNEDFVTTERRPSINGAINYARTRPMRIPRRVSQSYPAFKGKQEHALRIGIHEMFDKEIHRSTQRQYTLRLASLT